MLDSITPQTTEAKTYRQRLAALADNFERREQMVSKRYALTELMNDIDSLWHVARDERSKANG